MPTPNHVPPAAPDMVTEKEATAASSAYERESAGKEDSVITPRESTGPFPLAPAGPRGAPPAADALADGATAPPGEMEGLAAAVALVDAGAVAVREPDEDAAVGEAAAGTVADAVAAALAVTALREPDKDAVVGEAAGGAVAVAVAVTVAVAVAVAVTVAVTVAVAAALAVTDADGLAVAVAEDAASSGTLTFSSK
jgi:hypothetical protein